VAHSTEFSDNSVVVIQLCWQLWLK